MKWIVVRGDPVREVSDRLGVSPYSICNWMKLVAKVALIAEHRPVFSVRRMCHCFKISPSGFCA